MATTTYNLDYDNCKFQYWYNGSNKGLRGKGESYWDSDFRQLAYSGYTSNYYTTYMKFKTGDDSVTISTKNKTYYPTKIQIVATRASGHGSSSSEKTARFGCVTAANADGASGLHCYNNITVKGTGSGEETYTITSDTTQAQKYVTILAGGGYLTLGCNTKPSSKTSPMDITNYLALATGGSSTGIKLKITWATRTSKCKAPTSLSIKESMSYYRPGDPITIKFSGADKGTNNDIVGYTLYYKVGGVPTSSDHADWTYALSFSKEDYNTKSGEISITKTIEGVTTVGLRFATSHRGETYYFKIVTRGSAGSSYYSKLEDSAYCSITVNTLPTALTGITLKYTEVPADGANHNISIDKFTGGATNNTGQTLQYKYNVGSNDKTKAKACTTSTSIAIPGKTSGSTEVYVWSFDGLELSSSSVKATVQHIEAPTGITLTIENPTDSYYSGKNIYYKGCTLKASVSGYDADSLYKKGTYYFQYKVDNGSWTDFNEKGISTTSHEIKDLSSYVSLTSSSTSNRTISFRVRFQQTLKFSAGNTKITSSTASKTIYLLPTKGDTINNKSNTNIAGGLNNYFSKAIRQYFTKDTGITDASCKVTYTENGQSKTKDLSVTRSFSGDSPYVDINTSDLPAGITYKFTITLKRGTNQTNTYSISNYTKIHSIELKNLESKDTTTTLTLKPHSDFHSSDFYNFSFYSNILNAYTQNTTFNDIQTALKTYGIKLSGTNLDDSYLEGLRFGIYRTYMENGKETTKYWGTTTLDGSEEGTYKYTGLKIYKKANVNDSLFIKIKKSFFGNICNKGVQKERFGLTNADFDKNFTGQFYFKVYGTNLYGDSYSNKEEDNLKVNVNFIENLTRDNFKFSVKDANDNLLTAKQVLKQNDSIKYHCEITTYNNSKITLQPQENLGVYNSEGLTFNNFSNSTESSTLSPNFSTTRKIGDKDTLSKSITRIFNTQILTTGYTNFCLIATQNNSTITKQHYANNGEDCAILIQQGDTAININSASYDGKTLKLNHNKIDFNLKIIDDNNLVYIGSSTKSGKFQAGVWIVYSDSEDFTNSTEIEIKSLSNATYRENIGTTISSDAVTTDWNGEDGANELLKEKDRYYVKIKITTQIDNNKITTDSNIFVVHNISPTVSYRKNCLGINTRGFDETKDEYNDAILVLNASSSKQKIKCISDIFVSGGTW